MTLQVVRAVDNLERYNITRSNLNIYHNVVIGNRIRSLHPAQRLPPFTLPASPQQPQQQPQQQQPQQQQWAQLLLDPITQLLDQHPSLAVVIGDHLTARPMFLRLETIDLVPLIRVVTLKDSLDISRVLEQEHNLPFDLSDQTRPLWRLVIALMMEGDLSSVYVLYTFHHVIADGRSAMALTAQLIELLNRQAQAQSQAQAWAGANNRAGNTKIPVRSMNPMPASIEQRVNCYPSLRTLVLEVIRALLLPGILKKALERRYWAGEIDSSLEVPNETELGFLRFSKEETQKIVQAAKTHATTVQAVLYAASVFATKAVFMSSGSISRDGDHEDGSGSGSGGKKARKEKEKEEEKEEGIVFATPVSLRNLIPNKIAPEDQGNYTSEILHPAIHVNNSSEFWEMTRIYRAQVVASTTTTRGVQELLEHFGMLNLLSKKDGGWETFMTSKVKKDQHGRKASIKLSNLGSGWGQQPSRHVCGSGHDTVTDTGTRTGPEREGEVEFLIEDAVFSQSSGVTASALTMNVATANGVMTVTTTWQKAGFRGRERGDVFVEAFRRILFEAIEGDDGSGRRQEKYFFSQLLLQ
ncbi:hypothetical protein BC939DRAFT_469002 [Gamsiella multidivaricata]|uniref:uncharacterized protein n=1 Tax=Gamsiella multidivaricata TaxID=101098 RepID=UPI002220EA4F|nr:uncharacterized protein BC939DRAFT_469002 [Gamsiella multidivaricata]KAG0359863.1 hypothetical protein BGZ54_009800 [Gamsiella multidivaricata]KAI7816470.1 hypothetical protein BC939DRAFT_469002 [Gamsiella multidivaricata]